MVPAAYGVAGYPAPIVVTTTGYALFQAANNTAALRDTRADQRGVVSGPLSLSRNLGLITGASMMGLFFRTPAALVAWGWRGRSRFRRVCIPPSRLRPC